MTQQEADKQIKSTLESYLSNKNNSVSGDNFSNLILKLESIENTWFTETVIPYLSKEAIK
jgi:hypothetical protein